MSDEDRKPMVMGYSDEDGSKQASEDLDRKIADLRRSEKIVEFRVRARQLLGMLDLAESVGAVVLPSPVSNALTLARMVTREAAMLLGIDLS